MKAPCALRGPRWNGRCSQGQQRSNTITPTPSSPDPDGRNMSPEITSLGGSSSSLETSGVIGDRVDGAPSMMMAAPHRPKKRL